MPGTSTVLFGSSPLARGTLFGEDIVHTAHRLIPARAGNISGPDKRYCSNPAHPRSRGEHKNRAPNPCVRVGSSPLARGTFVFSELHKLRGRLIPARAGNIGDSFASSLMYPAHPRSRGEHHSIATESPAGRGSSPLARGTSSVHFETLPNRRLIPARAGNIQHGGLTIFRGAAHPRSRGEHAC